MLIWNVEVSLLCVTTTENSDDFIQIFCQLIKTSNGNLFSLCVSGRPLPLKIPRRVKINICILVNPATN